MGKNDRNANDAAPVGPGLPANDPLVRTGRLVLRRAVADDLEPMHRVLSDERAMRFWSTSPHSSLEQTARWLEKMILAPEDSSNEFVVELEGQVIGKAGCWRLPEIGFILHPDFWGRGLAFEALQAVISSTLAKFPVPELTADVDPLNRDSLRLLRRLGFQTTGHAARTFFVNGCWHDSVYLALVRESARFAQDGTNGP